MAIQGIDRGDENLLVIYRKAVFKNKDLLNHILSQIHTLIDMSKLQLVCRNWHNSVKPRFALHVTNNFEKLAILKIDIVANQFLLHTPMPIDHAREYVHSLTIPSIVVGLQYTNPTFIKKMEYAALQILIETAKAQGCVNISQAKSTLLEAKTRAKGLDWSLGQINMLTKIVKVEICIDPAQAKPNLSDFEAFSSTLPEPFQSYAYFKIAELRAYLGEAETSLIAEAQNSFLKAATVERAKALEQPNIPSHAPGRPWGATKKLIDIAWAEAHVSLAQATITIRLLAEKSELNGTAFCDFLRMQMVLNKEDAGMDVQQKELLSALMDAGRQCLDKDFKSEVIEADRKSLQIQPVTADNLEAVKQDVMEFRDDSLRLFKATRTLFSDKDAVQKIQRNVFQLIEVARFEATIDSEIAWTTLTEAIPFVSVLEDRTYLIIQLFKETLRI